MTLNLAAVRQGQAGGQCGDGKASFISRPTVSKVPSPQRPPPSRIPGGGPQLSRTGFSSFTLLAASPISSQKLPNSSLELLQLPRLAIRSSSPQLF